MEDSNSKDKLGRRNIYFNAVPLEFFKGGYKC